MAASLSPPSPITPPESPTRGLVSSRSPSPDFNLNDGMKKVFYNDRRSFDPTGLLQKTDDREEKVALWTDIAKIYSHPIGPTEISDGKAGEPLKNTGKSGITPIPTPELGATPEESRKNLAKYDRLVEMQRMRFKGFEAAELFTIGAMAYFDRDTMPDGLTNPIHPVFQLSQWETQDSLPKHKGSLPLFGDYDSLWEARNPVVWNLIEPALKVASLVLTNPETNVWFDALLDGVYTEIRNPDPKGPYAASFAQRPLQLRNSLSAKTLLNEKLTKAAKEIRFFFASAMTNHYTGLPNGAWTPMYAETSRDDFTGMVNVAVEIEYIQPLLRNDLTEAERRYTQFRLGYTLFHEFAHALFWTSEMRKKHPKIHGSTIYEPFFEQEPTAELGYSLEEFVWKGIHIEINDSEQFRRGPGLPAMGFFKTSFFQKRHRRQQFERPDIAKLPISSYACDDYWPIPIRYCEKMFQQQFWDGPVTSFGLDATAMGPATYGSRISKIGEFQKRERVAAEYGGARLNANSSLMSQIVKNSMTVGEKEAAEQAYNRLIAAQRIHMAMEANSKRRVYARQQITGGGWQSPNSVAFSDDESLVEVEDEIIYSCARYQEIASFLVANRGPWQLALDTQNMISEANFYRYIQDSKGLQITPRELRGFLGVCNRERKMFLHDCFPGYGTVTRIEAGWPVNIFLPYSLPTPTVPSGHKLKRDFLTIISAVSKFMKDRAWKRRIYTRHGETRDVALTTLFSYLNYSHRKNGKGWLNPDVLEDAVLQYIQDQGRHSKMILGPKGIVRFKYDIAETRIWANEDKVASQRLLRRNLRKAKMALDLERSDSACSKSGDSVRMMGLALE